MSATIDHYCLYVILIFDYHLQGYGKSAVVITENDEAFGIGDNWSGCLGVGDYERALAPRKIDGLSRQNIKGMIQFDNDPQFYMLT